MKLRFFADRLWRFAARELVIVLLVLSLALTSWADDDTASREIEYLLGFVSASDCTFIRNGSEHDASDAASHLRFKYQRASRHAKTADNFIDRLATKSSFSGKPYRMVCDGEELLTGAWLHKALSQYRESYSDPVDG